MTVLVIGDSCSDAYIYGACERLCPAAPVPVFVPGETSTNEGMAGNVLSNLQILGVSCEFLTNPEKITKTRYVEKKTNQMIVRVDIGDNTIRRIQNLRNVKLKNYDAVVISDYNKGFLLKEDIQYIAKTHNTVFMDTKKLLGKWCRDCTFIKINEYEYARSKHLLDACGEWMDKKLIITQGCDGCIYNGKTFGVQKVEIKDLCGAGDTFLAGLVAEYIKSRDIKKAITAANECATEVVQGRGVTLPNKFTGRYTE